jgi:DNA-binding XRE family transcriptional regulator
MHKTEKDAVDLYMDVIGQNVRRLRGETSQVEFAKKVHVSHTTLHRIESRKNFQIQSLLSIAVSCGVYPYEFCLTEEERVKLHLRTDVLVESFKEVIKKEIIAELLNKIDLRSRT